MVRIEFVYVNSAALLLFFCHCGGMAAVESVVRGAKRVSRAFPYGHTQDKGGRHDSQAEAEFPTESTGTSAGIWVFFEQTGSPLRLRQTVQKSEFSILNSDL